MRAFSERPKLMKLLLHHARFIFERADLHLQLRVGLRLRFVLALAGLGRRSPIVSLETDDGGVSNFFSVAP